MPAVLVVSKLAKGLVSLAAAVLKVLRETVMQLVELVQSLEKSSASVTWLYACSSVPAARQMISSLGMGSQSLSEAEMLCCGGGCFRGRCYENERQTCRGQDVMDVS